MRCPDLAIVDEILQHRKPQNRILGVLAPAELLDFVGTGSELRPHDELVPAQPGEKHS